MWPSLELWTLVSGARCYVVSALLGWYFHWRKTHPFCPCVVYLPEMRGWGQASGRPGAIAGAKLLGLETQRSKPAIDKAGPETPATKSMQWALSQRVCMVGRLLRQ